MPSKMEQAMEYGYSALDGGWVPDPVLRTAIRQLLKVRLREINRGSLPANHAAKMEYVQRLASPQQALATHQEEANAQHYEVPTSFLELCLGPRMKYSSCFYPSLANADGTSKPISYAKESLGEAEEAMLKMYTVKAGLGPVKGEAESTEGEGLKMLDLGCGWGSLGLYLAEKYPKASIKMLSNSRTQKIYIDGVCKEKGFGNVEVITGDFTKFDFEEKEQFTHILSIEMFEHMKGYPALFAKLATWLQPGGKVFIHVFCHKDTPYDFEENDGWMSKHFFSGGTMPSLDLFTYFQKDLTLLHSDFLPGTHYAQTLESWLKLQDKNAKQAIKILEDDAEAKGFGKEEGRKTFYRFRVFFLACAELFNFNKNGLGEEWGLGHYLFEKRAV
ncbi:hypothetical protein QFC21_003866 [Naganishia friedmannii]|uniref:Uncharacterized protein n=1 Tax=Naganishia friedmannii TaxID=89922 RepID=A0ACC2VKP8_9TREE|nr:hypothetical protein QFC21_003866 [Naganishia friedmannii]